MSEENNTPKVKSAIINVSDNGTVSALNFGFEVTPELAKMMEEYKKQQIMENKDSYNHSEGEQEDNQSEN